jgi:biotin carboxyl carrier protein
MTLQNTKQNGDNGMVEFVVTARKYKTTLTNKYLNREKWEQPIVGQVKSFLPGTVISVNVKKGQTVLAGDLLLEHEAMKMINRIAAPVAGIITGVHVIGGQQVSKNFLMIEIEPD